jgi:hypothetical protein
MIFASLVRRCILALSATVSGMAAASSDPMHATFRSPSGDDIIVDTTPGAFRAPRAKETTLTDCSDEFQTCFTDGHGFAFSYYRKCDANLQNESMLKFKPKILSVLHSYVWLVFDESPNYVFEYVDQRGLVGIFIGPTRDYDFRDAFRDRNFRIGDMEGFEYRAVDSRHIGKCTWRK